MKELLYFTAEWCHPCGTLSPIMEQVRQEIPVNKINVDIDKLKVMEYHVRSVPTVILLNNGIEVNRFVGVKSKEQIIQFCGKN